MCKPPSRKRHRQRLRVPLVVGMRRGLPARNTFRPRRGARQPSSGVRITPTGDALWHATAPMRARPRAGRGSLAGTAPRATPPSAGCRTVWLHGCPVNSTPSKRWWRTLSRPRAWPPRPMGYAAMRSSSRGASSPRSSPARAGACAPIPDIESLSALIVIHLHRPPTRIVMVPVAGIRHLPVLRDRVRRAPAEGPPPRMRPWMP